MKRIPVDWSGQADTAANKVTIQIRSSEFLIDSILPSGLQDAHSLNHTTILRMQHLREWEKFPTRVLRSL
jgi:hypothetical protein